ncbi:uncharacterized protein LOC131303059 [Rhododendron vialii]|uniref:uncharacterized protein LOC131303059 n=1 Tax=Rhododendron vialii TaxID=182163 RepID=UPI00265F947B|nr:uncharacterized protein LOC131303059 [Rhododendron vialii]
MVVSGLRDLQTANQRLKPLSLSLSLSLETTNRETPNFETLGFQIRDAPARLKLRPQSLYRSPAANLLSDQFFKFLDFLISDGFKLSGDFQPWKLSTTATTTAIAVATIATTTAPAPTKSRTGVMLTATVEKKPPRGLQNKCDFKTNANPGRRFLGCVNYEEENACNFFIWVDPPPCRRGLEYDRNLQNKVKEPQKEDMI